MIYWYTGQPGHGKTLHALDHALELKDKGRLVFAGNVTKLDYDKSGFLPITPEQFRDWMTFLPDGAVCLIDEAYEHGMLTKRPPGAKVPPHVEQLAKHRHRGLDFIFVSQSPQTQCDSFVHDLIEQHIHVRRMWGLPFVRLRKFFYMERNPLKATPNVVNTRWLPKRPRDMYLSTTGDTTKVHVPWYAVALALLLVVVPIGAWLAVNDVESSLRGEDASLPAAAGVAASGEGKDGATATAAPEPEAPPPPSRELRTTNYAAWITPRIPGQPWTAPAYDTLSISPRAPRVFCAIYGQVSAPDSSCRCLTEQGTRYLLDQDQCQLIALNGQYEPFRDETEGDVKRLDDLSQRKRLDEAEIAARVAASSPEFALPGSTLDQVAAPAVADPLLGGQP